MSGIFTFSKFTYGHSISTNNRFIDFNEGAGQVTAELPIGSYTLSDMPDLVASALNTISTVVNFTVSLDIATRVLTITGDGVFDLLISSGTNISNSAFTLLGFTGADVTGLSSYEGDLPSGEVYFPQYMLQDYYPFDDYVEKAESVTRKSAEGDFEVVSFGENQYMECNLVRITNLKQSGYPIKDNPNGVSEFKDFMKYLINKRPVEFYPDENDVVNTACVIDRTPESRDGTAFKNKYMRDNYQHYESGRIRFIQRK